MDGLLWDGVNANRAADSDALDGLKPEQFIEAQFRKTELRKLYQDAEAADRVSKLMRAIETDVIPRIVSAHHKRGEPGRPIPNGPAFDAAHVASFAQILVCDGSGIDSARFVADIQAAGTTIETIYLELMAPAARHVGALWDDDQCTFLDVTLALGTLHRIMRSLSADFRLEHRMIDLARRVLLVPARGGEHTLGLNMVAEFFRRGAWTVDLVASMTDVDLSRAVKAEWFTVVGFSVACDPSLDTLAETIRIVRKASSNPNVGILVGGPAVTADHGSVARVGADGMATDAINAVLEAERFVLHTHLSS